MFAIFLLYKLRLILIQSKLKNRYERYHMETKQSKEEQTKLMTKFKYSASESFQKKIIDNIPTPTAGIEGNAICGNRLWVAVSAQISPNIIFVFYLFSSQSKVQVVFLWFNHPILPESWIILPCHTQSRHIQAQFKIAISLHITRTWSQHAPPMDP